jgi:uncharacterized integral membrane protein (TIGR00698 family)
MATLKSSFFPLPGWLLMIGISVLSIYLSRQIVIGNRNPVESVTIAILFGLFLKNLLPLPSFLNQGISNYEVPLKLGIILLGIGLSFIAVLEIGAKAITVILFCLLIAPVLLFIIGKKAGLSEKLSLLIGIGTTICGSTAIAITAPVIEAEGDDVSYSVATISLFGIGAMFLLPIAARLLGLNETTFGIWAGTAIHATPQVVAAGYMYGEVAGQVSTVAKLTRNIFMAPAVFLIGLWYMKKKLARPGSLTQKTKYSKAIPLFLFGFLGFAVIRTIGDGTNLVSTSQWRWLVQQVNELGKFLVLIAMAGIGLNTRLNTLRRIGPKPFFVGLVASVLLALISLLLICVISDTRTFRMSLDN